MKIRLNRLEDRDLNQILNMINSDEGLKTTFSGGGNTVQRVLDSVYAALIKNVNTTVGFVMITENPKNGKLEIDMGVLEKYRGMGYGTKAMELLKDIILYNELKVEVQIKKTNKAAIKSVLNNGFTLCKQDKLCNYYTVEEDSKHIK